MRMDKAAELFEKSAKKPSPGKDKPMKPSRPMPKRGSRTAKTKKA
jgi:hypothetical protein